MYNYTYNSMDPYYKKYLKYKTKYLQYGQTAGETAEQKGHDEQTYFYHGSSNKLEGDYLEPRPSKVIEGEEAVFATNEKYVSLVFIPKWSDCDLTFGFHNGKPMLMEVYAGAFDLLKNVSGYIYYVDPENFKKDKRLGMQGVEFISKKNEKILKKEVIEDVYAELKKSKINFITFGMKMKAIEKYLIKQ